MIFPVFKNPLVSIIIVTWNKADFTKRCLESILASVQDIPYEVIVVDNASSDHTGPFLDSLKNVHIIKNSKNLYYAEGNNQGVSIARGKYVYLLNSDTTIDNETISALLKVATTINHVGVVGSKLINPDGKLQEAGCMVWSDGSAFGYGRGDNPNKGEYNFVREVDFCSGASFFLKKKLYEDCGGLKRIYEPAYYEEVDLCMEIMRRGYKNYYQPRSEVVHYEYGSTTPEKATLLMQKNQKRFLSRWQKELVDRPRRPDPASILRNRDRRQEKPALFLAPVMTYLKSKIAFSMICDLQTRYKLTILSYTSSEDPTNNPVGYMYEEVGIEVLINRDLKTHLKDREAYYECVFAKPSDWFYNMSLFEAQNILWRMI